MCCNVVPLRVFRGRHLGRRVCGSTRRHCERSGDPRGAGVAGAVAYSGDMSAALTDTGPRAARIIERLDTLFEIDRAAGTNRPGLGAGEQRAFDQTRGWMEQAGLTVSVDPAGNLLGRLVGSRSVALAEVWTGSHLDTPPDGGRFDGALGVIAAIDALEAIAAGGGARRTLTVVAFRLEEGWRFGRGVFGSRAVAGMLERRRGRPARRRRDLAGRGVRGARPGASCRWAGGSSLRPPALSRPTSSRGRCWPPPACRLGVVTSIAGMAGIDIAFAGRRGHAGTTPMALRADALGAAARFVQTAHDTARAIPDAVCTVGRLTVAPGATNTIPGRVELFADLRAPDDERLEQLVSTVVAGAEARRRVRRMPRRGHPAVAVPVGADEPRTGGRAAPLDRPAGAGAVRAALRRGPRRGHHEHGRSALGDAVRAQRRRWHQPRAGGTHRGRRRRLVRGRARARAARAGGPDDRLGSSGAAVAAGARARTRPGPDARRAEGAVRPRTRWSR